MKLLNFDDWFDKYWEEPDNVDELSFEEINDMCIDEYDSFVSDYQDYAYEEYKDRMMMGDD